MALIHQGNRSAAKKIFNVFKKYYEAQGGNFQGLPKVWDPCTGLPHEDSNKWEGDSAFLLLALNYYKQSYGGFGRYKNLTQGLAAWLSQRADSCHQIVAEGVANMYAALAPFADDPTIQQRLPKLRDCFFSLVDYEQVLNHTVRGALVFGNTTGFKYVKNFAQSETWCVVNTKRTEAYRADKSEQFINVEISAQLLLTWKIWQSDLKPDLSNLRAELKKLLLRGMSNPRSLGLPYTVNEPVFTGACSLPIIDSTCYLLFYYWKFNPFAPHKKCAGCRYIER